MRGGQAFGHEYRRPGVDSPRARADAIWFLTNCGRLAEVTAGELADRYRLKVETAETLLGQERGRRAADAF